MRKKEKNIRILPIKSVVDSSSSKSVKHKCKKQSNEKDNKKCGYVVLSSASKCVCVLIEKEKLQANLEKNRKN